MVMNRDMVEVMLLDIDKNIDDNKRDVTRSDFGGVVIDAESYHSEIQKALEIFDWSIEKEMRKINWKGLKQTRIFKKGSTY